MKQVFQIHTEPAKIDALIKAIAKAGAKLDRDIQEAGLSALQALHDHGNIGYVNQLYNALPKGARKAALSSWYMSYGQIVANTEGDKKDKPFKYTKDKAATNVEGAMADPWYNHKPDQNPDEVFDLRKAVEGIIKKAQGKNLVHAEMLTGLQAMIVDAEPAPADEGSAE
jgi:hypothetical protein